MVANRAQNFETRALNAHVEATMKAIVKIIFGRMYKRLSISTFCLVGIRNWKRIHRYAP